MFLTQDVMVNVRHLKFSKSCSRTHPKDDSNLVNLPYEFVCSNWCCQNRKWVTKKFEKGVDTRINNNT